MLMAGVADVEHDLTGLSGGQVEKLKGPAILH